MYIKSLGERYRHDIAASLFMLILCVAAIVCMGGARFRRLNVYAAASCIN